MTFIVNYYLMVSTTTKSYRNILFIVVKNAPQKKHNFKLYMKHIFSKTCFTLNLRENESNKSCVAVFQI